MSRWLSPLRYPGGKARMSPALSQCLDLAVTDMSVEIWIEPFAGGLGAGLHMLNDGLVEEVWATEKSPALAAFWKECLANGGDLADEIVSMGRPNLDVFYAARHLASHPEEADSQRDLALAAFVTNRCSRSGIIGLGAGPIGGKGQEKYGVADRYAPEALADRIRFVHSMRHVLSVEEGDGITAVSELAGSGIEDEVFVFADPPYMAMGDRLYQDCADEDDHERLADALRQIRSPWILTYDKHPRVKELYSDQIVMEYEIRQSANTAKIDTEYAVFSPDDEIFSRIFASHPAHGGKNVH